jgi:hypothetical protein
MKSKKMPTITQPTRGGDASDGKLEGGAGGADLDGLGLAILQLGLAKDLGASVGRQQGRVDLAGATVQHGVGEGRAWEGGGGLKGWSQ